MKSPHEAKSGAKHCPVPDNVAVLSVPPANTGINPGPGYVVYPNLSVVPVVSRSRLTFWGRLPTMSFPFPSKNIEFVVAPSAVMNHTRMSGNGAVEKHNGPVACVL